MKAKRSSSGQLRQLLLAKLQVTERHLNRLIAKEAQKLPGTREEALWSLCYQRGLHLNKYLTSEELGRFRSLSQQNPKGLTVNLNPGRDLNVARRDVNIKK